MRFAASAAKCDSAYVVGPDIADAAVAAGIAPRPADTVIEQSKGFARRERADGLGIRIRRRAKFGRGRDRAVERLGIMGGDHAAGQSDVGEVRAIGVERWVGRVRRAGKREFLSGGRRPGFGR